MVLAILIAVLTLTTAAVALERARKTRETSRVRIVAQDPDDFHR